MEHADTLVQMLLGEKTSVEVKQVKASVTRFGISEQLSEMQSQTAVMSVANVLPDGVAKVCFRNRRDGTSLQFVFDIYRGGAAACVPAKFRVVRLKSSRFSIDMSMHDNSMNMFFHAREDVGCEVNELLKNYKLIKMMTNPSDVSISIDINGDVLTGRLSGVGFEGDFDRSLEMLDSASYVKGFYEYHDALEVIPNWFARNGDALIENVRFLRNLTILNKVHMNFTLADGTTDLTEAECVVALPIVLGERCFVSLLAYGGDLENKGGGSYELVPTRVTVIYKTHFTIDYLVSGKAALDLEEALDSYEGAETIVPFIDTYMGPLLENAKRALGKRTES